MNYFGTFRRRWNDIFRTSIEGVSLVIQIWLELNTIDHSWNLSNVLHRCRQEGCGIV